MFTEFVLFELKLRAKRFSTYVYFLMLFGMSFLAMNAMGGAVKSITVSLGTSGGQVFINAPYVIHFLTLVFSYLGLMISAAIMSRSIYRDFEFESYPLFFVLPITKFGYLGGRFVGSFLVLMAIFSGIGLGLFTGSLMPYLDRSTIGPNLLKTYVAPYLSITLPTLFLTGTIFFAIAAMSRKILPSLIAGIVLLIGYQGAQNLILNDLDNKTMANLLDPFGFTASELITEYWTIHERNTQIVPFETEFLWNRLLWLVVGIGFIVLAYKKFSFTHTTVGGGAKPGVGVNGVLQTPQIGQIRLPVFQPTFSLSNTIRLWARLTLMEFRGVVKSRHFLILALAGLLFIAIDSEAVGKMYGTKLYPVTNRVLGITGSSFELFITIILIIYSGELIWRTRTQKSEQLYDSLPAPTWAYYLSKLMALVLAQGLLLGLVLLSGLMIQIGSGYYHFELGLYLKFLYGIRLIDYLLLTVLAMFIHTVVNHKYVGYFVVIAFYVANNLLNNLGFTHNLAFYNSDPGIVYSDMNGFGHGLGPYLTYKLYWALVAGFLAVLTVILWTRGIDSDVRSRIALAKRRTAKPVIVALATLGVAAIATGSYIYYNTAILNHFYTAYESQELTADYERRYKQYESLSQPTITAVDLEIDIYPAERRYRGRGTYYLRNKTQELINQVHIQFNTDLELQAVSFEGGFTLREADHRLGYYIYDLKEPLQPEQSLTMDFTVEYAPRGFHTQTDDFDIVANGSFFHNDSFLPSIGYNRDAELSSTETRKKHSLPERKRMAPQDDLTARMNNYVSHDGDWITFTATVSTAADQYAIAPGYLTREWRAGDRRYFRYEMDAPILNYYPFLSARYEVYRDSWQDVALEIYYHKAHAYNLKRMAEALKTALEYYSREYAPYPHRQLRIIEFPGYKTFAQSFPNTIPFSEGIGFIARLDDDPNALDYVSHVTAHETAHQWWAHQVIGANVQGCTLMSETLAEYSALMVMEHLYGREKMQKFLKYEIDDYLAGRSGEKEKELPLMLVENQGYIHYNKGGHVMYALRDYIGEAALNQALSRYLKAVRYQEPPYTIASEFLTYLEAATPPDLQYLIDDLFRTITLFDNRAEQATARKLQNDRYEVTLTASARKLQADELGKESEVNLHDLIDIGVFGKDGKELYLQKHRIEQNSLELAITVDEEPAEAGIDPYNKLIDRKPDDNKIKIKTK